MLWHGSSSMVQARTAKPAAKVAKAAAPQQRIYSLSQDQQNSDALKIWGVPACVLAGKERPHGVYVTGFTGEGLGNQLGLEIGDVLLSLNGHVLSDAKSADTILAKTRSGQLQAVIARATSAPGGISYLMPRINYVAGPSFGAYGSGSTSTGMGNPEGASASSEMNVSALEDYMFNLVNEDRRANGGIPPLKKSATLGALARKYANDMNKRNFFGHDDPDGLDPKGRARRDGIGVSVWENLAMESGTRNYQSLVLRGERQMMDEPPNVPNNHRGCILREQHHCIGIGVSIAPNKVYCVQEFSPTDLP